MCVGTSTSNAAETSGMMWSLEDMLDALDIHGVPDELLSKWTSQEEDWRSWEGCPASCSLPTNLRQAALHFLHHILSTAGLAHTSIFEAAMLLDLYLMKAPALKNVEALLATCAAVAHLMMKIDLGPSARRGIPFDFSSVIASWLQASGVAQVSFHVATAADIMNSQEVEILEKLEFQVKFPTSEAWISVFFSRFDVISQSRYAHALSNARWRSMVAADFMMRTQASSNDMPPKRLAVGLFCLSLASDGVVSFDAIAPFNLGSEQWTQLHLEAGFGSRAPEDKPRGAQHKVMSRFLTWATGESKASMVEHCHAVALALRCAVQGSRYVPRGPHADI